MNNKVVLFAVLSAFTLTVNAAPGKLLPQFGKGYKYFEGTKELLKLHIEKRTFQDAKNICQEEKAVLAFWDSTEEKSSFASIAMQNAVWIGAYIQNLILYSSNGTNIDEFTPEYTIDIHNYGLYSSQVFQICMIDGDDSTACPNEMRFICRKHLNKNIDYSLSNNSVPFFRNDYIYNEKNNYALKKHSPRLWNEAIMVCESEGAELLTVEEDDDVSELISMLNTGEIFWVGASDLLVESKYETINGTPLTKPINITFGHCVTINDVGLYESISCQENVMFLCQKRFETYNFECDTVDSEYVKLPRIDKCVKYHSIPKNWHNALELCQIENATLFVIDSQREASILNDKLKEIEKPSILHYDHSIFHVGFHDLFIDGMYKTVDGFFLKNSGYTAWSKFYPKANIGMRCGGMVEGGTLQNGGCDVPAMFACQKRSLRNY